MVENFGEQLFFAGEVVVHRALGNAGGGGDPVHAGDLEPIDPKLCDGGGQDGFAFALGEALRRSHEQ